MDSESVQTVNHVRGVPVIVSMETGTPANILSLDLIIDLRKYIKKMNQFFCTRD